MGERMSLATEICVLGGGPAGSAIARQLVLLGHDVCLIERVPFPRPHVGESLPARILPLLQVLGVREHIEEAGFLRPERAVIQWSGTETIRKVGHGPPGFLVDRGRFDALLLAAASEAGARILQPVTALRPEHLGLGRWHIPLADAPYAAIEAHFVVDATGRRALLGGRRQRLSAPTLALFARWHGAKFEPHETALEAGPAAWYWGAPLPDDTYNATVFLAPQPHLIEPDIGTLYRQLIARSELLHDCLRGTLAQPVIACNAGAYRSTCPIDHDYIRIGEAALCLDPISAQGITLALQSAIQGAIVVHTLLAAPTNADDAIAFYIARQDEAAIRHITHAAQIYCDNRTYCDEPFWQDRSKAPQAAPQPPAAATLAARLQPETQVQLAPTAQLTPTPCIMGDLIQSRNALLHPNLERPVAYLGPLELAPLLRRITPGISLQQLLALWSEQVDSAQALDVARWLVERGILMPTKC
jgi:flavin-dependent dehydrogenase